MCKILTVNNKYFMVCVTVISALFRLCFCSLNCWFHLSHLQEMLIFSATENIDESETFYNCVIMTIPTDFKIIRKHQCMKNMKDLFVPTGVIDGTFFFLFEIQNCDCWYAPQAVWLHVVKKKQKQIKAMKLHYTNSCGHIWHCLEDAVQTLLCKNNGSIYDNYVGKRDT